MCCQYKCKIYLLLILIFIYEINIMFSSFNKVINKNIKIEGLDYNFNKELEKKNIYKKYTFDTLASSYNKSKEFINLNINGILINNKTDFKSNQNPLVSVIIPIYNSQNFIYRTIKSIQNQNILDIEIILINDYSTDNTSDIIMKFHKEDPRIIIINNKKNMGILYSRSIGVLSAKGKFIFSLDNDDMFLSNDVISSIIEIAKNGNFDIVEFKGISSNNIINLTDYTILKDLYFSNRKINNAIFQPDLSYYSIKISMKFGSYKLNSVYIWNKCIKKSIYQKALNKLGKNKYSRYMLAHEDVLAVFIIFNIANSYIYVGKYGIFRFIRKDGAYSKTKKDKYIKSIKDFYLLDAVIVFSNNLTKHQTLIIYMLYKIMSLKVLQTILLENKSFKKALINCLEQILNSKNISKRYKDIILSKSKSINLLNFLSFR